MNFCTAINCMDGRTQLPVIGYLKKKFNAKYVDMITEAGPNKILAVGVDGFLVKSIIKRVRISVEKHGSEIIAIVGHFDCAGNPSIKEEQAIHTKDAIDVIKKEFPHMNILGLWVDQNGVVSELEENS
jgi:carbonic anhydrase